MVLKAALGPTILSGISIIPVIMFSGRTKRQYRQAFLDTALLQTSLLDGWDTAEQSSPAQREVSRSVGSQFELSSASVLANSFDFLYRITVASLSMHTRRPTYPSVLLVRTSMSFLQLSLPLLYHWKEMWNHRYRSQRDWMLSVRPRRRLRAWIMRGTI
jgi:hypothetical protein